MFVLSGVVLILIVVVLLVLSATRPEQQHTAEAIKKHDSERPSKTPERRV